MKKFFALSIMLLGLAAGSFAQTGDSETATASATIITPLTMTKVSDLLFGNVIPNATLAGTVALPTAGPAVYTNAAYSAVPAATMTVAPAQFTVTGTPSTAIAITYPTAPITLNGTPSGTMTVDPLVNNLGASSTLDGAGSATILIGGTLNVAASQAAGTYTSAAFTVSVDYE